MHQQRHLFLLLLLPSPQFSPLFLVVRDGSYIFRVKVVQTSFQNCKLEHLQKMQHGLDHIIGAQTRPGGVDGSQRQLSLCEHSCACALWALLCSSLCADDAAAALHPVCSPLSAAAHLSSCLLLQPTQHFLSEQQFWPLLPTSASQFSIVTLSEISEDGLWWHYKY